MAVIPDDADVPRRWFDERVTTDVMVGQCAYCGRVVDLFDRAPDWARIDAAGHGWATDDTGDVLADFVCPARETSARYPDGKPHEPTTTPQETTPA